MTKVLIGSLVFVLSTCSFAFSQQAASPTIMRLDTTEKFNTAAAKWTERTGKIVGVSLSTAVPASMNVTTFYNTLDTWPTIKLIVTPVPPRDYVVMLNGTRKNSTEQGEYIVPKGTMVQLVVSRPSIPVCKWTQRVVRDEQVICRLP
jgi:hypothetical protein